MQPLRKIMLLAILGMPLLAAEQAAAQVSRTSPKRYAFVIDPKTPVVDLLPATPVYPSRTPLWLLNDPGQAPEVFFEPGVFAKVEPRSAEAAKAEEQIAHTIAKINFLSRDGKDQYLDLLCAHRADLVGLPWIKGEACQLTQRAGVTFLHAVDAVRERDRKPPPSVAKEDEEQTEQARIKAMVQIHGVGNEPGADDRSAAGLVSFLARIKRPEATAALARIAVFPFPESTRRAAIAELGTRPAAEVRRGLIAGLRYPWPLVAANAAQALSTLDLPRGATVAELLPLLDEPDPLAPVWKRVDGVEKPFTREVVRIHHNRNCLLCHAPANTPDVVDARGRVKNVVVGPVPTPGLPLPRLYYAGESPPERLVRADVTYLRQDFSLLLKVKDPGPWPASQRFDFVVQEREMSFLEVKEYNDWALKQGIFYVPPHRLTLVLALRRLTGLEIAETTSQGWRKALGEK